MSDKDVLRMPPPPPPSRRRAETEDSPLHHVPPAMTPDSGPGGTPSIRHPHIIEPVPGPGRYPGVSVT
jgi:hypothetical protein